MSGNTTIFGIYLNLVNLRKSVDCLKAIGCKSGDISVLSPERAGAIPVEGQTNGITARSEAVIAGSLGCFTFISTPPLGLLTRALTSLGVPAYEAERYENRIKNGAILLSVRSGGSIWTQRINEVLKQTGAEEVSKSDDAVLSISARPSPQQAPSPRTLRTGKEIEHRESVFAARAAS